MCTTNTHSTLNDKKNASQCLSAYEDYLTFRNVPPPSCMAIQRLNHSLFCTNIN